jgi:uncharacterized coiled-coil protein SlyX
MALGIIPGALDSASKDFVDMKVDLDEEKVARLAAQVEIDVLSQAVKDLTTFTDKFATQIPTLEDKVKHLENKVVDGLNEVRARELCLECTTQANDEFQMQISQLTEKLESKFLAALKLLHYPLVFF